MSPTLPLHWEGAFGLSWPLALKWALGRGKTKTADKCIALSILACHSSGSKSIAVCLTSWRHGLHRLLDSTMTPRPTWRLLPCGAALPRTVKVKLLQSGVCAIDCFIQQVDGQLGWRDFTLLSCNLNACNIHSRFSSSSCFRDCCQLVWPFVVKMDGNWFHDSEKRGCMGLTSKQPINLLKIFAGSLPALHAMNACLLIQRLSQWKPKRSTKSNSKNQGEHRGYYAVFFVFFCVVNVRRVVTVAVTWSSCHFACCERLLIRESKFHG